MTSREKAEARAPETPTGDTLRDEVIAMMKARGWSLDWTHRGAYLHLEASELIEAIRGKRGDTLGESADVLLTLLGLSPHSLSEIIECAREKLRLLRAKPQYPAK